MSGTAQAYFECGAEDSDAPLVLLCMNSVTVDLFNDGQYDNFNRPEGWHIELGTTIDRTIVRCPDHCEWVFDDFQSHPVGHWVDAT